MDDHYYFFDRSAVNSLWKMSWQEFLLLHGNSDWAKYPEIGSADGSLRGLIAFALDPEPSAAEVEDIIHRRTVRGTIERSSPQFYVMEEIVHHILACGSPTLRSMSGKRTSLFCLPQPQKATFAVKLRHRHSGRFSKLHYSKFEDFIRLSKRERSVVRGLMDVDQYAKPIYPWQGGMAILDEEWAGCLGVADTKRFFALVDRLWKQNTEVKRILDAEGIELRKPERKTRRFRDFGISRHLTNLWTRKIQCFRQPCVLRRWE